MKTASHLGQSLAFALLLTITSLGVILLMFMTVGQL